MDEIRHYSESAVLTDLYAIAMLQGYFSRGMNGTAGFEFFVRSLPIERNFLIAGERAIDLSAKQSGLL